MTYTCKYKHAKQESCYDSSQSMNTGKQNKSMKVSNVFPGIRTVRKNLKSKMSISIKEDVKDFVKEILSYVLQKAVFILYVCRWDFYTDVIDDHADSEEAREKIRHGSMFFGDFVYYLSYRCRNSVYTYSF